MSSPRHHRFGFWAIAFAYATVMALSAVPSPLYPIYQRTDGFSTFTVTLVYAAYAIGVAASLFLAGHLSDRHGRRRVLAPALGLAAVSAAVFLLFPQLPGLFAGRVLNGLAVGVVTSTATVWLAELHPAPRRAQLVAAAANLGGIGAGPLVAGFLAQYVAHPLHVPFAIFLGLTLVALVLVLLVPETREAPVPRPPYRTQRVSVPPAARSTFLAAAAAAFLGFAALGMFSGLAGTLLAGTLGYSSRALAGTTIFIVFGAGVALQLATPGWPPRRNLAVGMTTVVAGLAVVVLAVWLPRPDLGLFIAGGALTGAGGGAMFKGALATVAAIAAPERRAEALAGFFLAGYVGLSIPVIALGVALQELSAKATLLGFAAIVAAGIAAASRPLLGRAHPARLALNVN
ncbi:MFS transporter [Candidatus Solirubrobacter pratensis]|uniref:MFS transporter n=1 Tax=Candidatus Solirubrobacter pratensis TaxID=1298857 RepID=UPI000429A360|nr:MFS transporter [Candidatus Solirubrobacter pratensis]